MSDYFWNSTGAPPAPPGGVFGGGGGDPYGPPNMIRDSFVRPAGNPWHTNAAWGGAPGPGWGGGTGGVAPAWGQVGPTASPVGHLPVPVGSIGAGTTGTAAPTVAGGSVPPWWGAFQSYIQSKFPNFQWPTGVHPFGGPPGPPVRMPPGDVFGPPNLRRG